MTAPESGPSYLYVCGCGASSDSAHRPGCWLDRLERFTTSAAAAAHNAGTSVLVGVVTSLRGLGVLRDPDGAVELYALLDHLYTLGLLRPLCTQCGQRIETPLDSGLCAVCDFAAITGQVTHE